MRGTPALQAATAWSALESCSGAMSFVLCSARRIQDRDQQSAMTRPWTRIPSCVVMKINLIAFNASATATATRRNHAIRLAVAVESERRDDRHDALREQRLEQFGVHALDLAVNNGPHLG